MVSSYILKIIAAAAMLIDHAGYALSCAGKIDATPLYFVLRSVGRIAFPLYAFLLVNGFEKTGNRGKYLTRLCIFAVISQIPYSFFLCKSNYMPRDNINSFGFRCDLPLLVAFALIAAAYLLEGRKRNLLPLCLSVVAALFTGKLTLTLCGYVLLGSELNIFYTLACSLSVIWVFDLLRNRKQYSAVSLITAAAVGVAVCALLVESMDYRWRGLLLVVLLYFFRGKPKRQALMTVLWGVFFYLRFDSTAIFLGYLAGFLLAAVCIFFYSGTQGRKSRAFYYVYPVHLAVYGLFFHFLLHG